MSRLFPRVRRKNVPFYSSDHQRIERESWAGRSSRMTAGQERRKDGREDFSAEKGEAGSELVTGSLAHGSGQAGGDWCRSAHWGTGFLGTRHSAFPELEGHECGVLRVWRTAPGGGDKKLNGRSVCVRWGWLEECRTPVPTVRRAEDGWVRAVLQTSVHSSCTIHSLIVLPSGPHALLVRSPALWLQPSRPQPPSCPRPPLSPKSLTTSSPRL